MMNRGDPVIENSLYEQIFKIHILCDTLLGDEWCTFSKNYNYDKKKI